MRHRRKGRHLGRSSSHRKALMKNLASSLILTEREDFHYEGLVQADGVTEVKPPRIKGRIKTTLHKAKEVRPFVEKCITIARKALPHLEAAKDFGTSAERNTEAWKQWRESDNYRKWNETMAPAIAARRRVFSMLRDKVAVQILFDVIAPRFADRPGGYTRILKLAQPRLGDGGAQAFLEFVGKNDRVTAVVEKPAFESTPAADSSATPTNDSSTEEETPVDETVAEDSTTQDSTTETAEEKKTEE